MPKGGCSKTPQPEDFSLSNDMVEKQTGKKVLCLVHSPSFMDAVSDAFKPSQYFMCQEAAAGCYHESNLCLVLGQLMGSALFLGDCHTSWEVLWPHRPDLDWLWGNALEEPFLQALCIFKALHTEGPSSAVMAQVCVCKGGFLLWL